MHLPELSQTDSTVYLVYCDPRALESFKKGQMKCTNTLYTLEITLSPFIQVCMKRGGHYN